MSSCLSFAWTAFKISFYVTLALIIIVIGSYIAVNNNPYLSKKMKGMMHDRNIAYIFARYMRKISLPLHSVLDLKNAQKWECLVQNPFYKPGMYLGVALFVYMHITYIYLLCSNINKVMLSADFVVKRISHLCV